MLLQKLNKRNQDADFRFSRNVLVLSPISGEGDKCGQHESMKVTHRISLKHKISFKKFQVICQPYRQRMQPCILAGDGGCQVRGVDVEEKGCQGRSLRNTILEASLPASLVVTGGKAAAAIANQIHDHDSANKQIKCNKTFC